MRDREIIRRQIGALRVLVDEAGVGIIENLAVAVIFHHDEENMVEMRNVFRYSAFLSECDSCESNQQSHCEHDFFHNGLLEIFIQTFHSWRLDLLRRTRISIAAGRWNDPGGER